MRAFNRLKVPLPSGNHLKAVEALNLSTHVMIEVGCGVGLHPIQYASSSPESLVIALERTHERSRKCHTNVTNTGLKNILPVHADAINWVSHYIKPSSVDAYFILYPNPYPKPKQSNQRFVNMPFMAYLIETLKTNGTVTMASNIKSYCDEAAQKMTSTWGLELASRSTVSISAPPRTHFEKKYLERAEICENLIFRKPTATHSQLT